MCGPFIHSSSSSSFPPSSITWSLSYSPSSHLPPPPPRMCVSVLAMDESYDDPNQEKEEGWRKQSHASEWRWENSGRTGWTWTWRTRGFRDDLDWRPTAIPMQIMLPWLPVPSSVIDRLPEILPETCVTRVSIERTESFCVNKNGTRIKRIGMKQVERWKRRREGKKRREKKVHSIPGGWWSSKVPQIRFLLSNPHGKERRTDRSME